MRAGGRLFLAFLGAAAVLSLLFLPRLRFEHGARSLLRADPGAERVEAELRRPFGSDDVLLLAWEVDDATLPATWLHVRAVTEAIGAIEGLEEVYSIANVPLIVGGFPRPIHQDDLATPEGRARVREALRASPVYLGTIYNDALDVVAVAGTLRALPEAEGAATIRAVRAAAGRLEAPGRPIHVAGVTALAVEAGEYAVRDLVRVGSVALGVTLAVLLLVTGTVREMLVALVATGLPPLYALGLAAVLGIPVTALGAALFPVLAVVGITSGVHLLNAYGEERRLGRGASEAARRARNRVAAPVVLSLLTSAAAFFSLQATGVPAFHSAGNLVASGLVGTIPVLLLGLPAALALIRPRGHQRAARRLDRPLLRLSHAVGQHARPLVLAGVAACAAGALLAANARVSVDVLQAFQPGSRIARTYRFLDARLTPTLYADVVLEAAPEAGISDIVADLDRFAGEALAIPGVENVLSLASLVRYGQKVVALEAAALTVLRGPAFERVTRRFEDVEGRRYRAKVRIREGSPPGVLEQLERKALAMRTGKAFLTGLYPRAVATTKGLVRDLAAGTALMMLVVVATVTLALRSWRLGIVAILPNLLPPAIVFGVVAALGIPLDVSAVAVGGVAVGLAVDDSFHVLFRLRDEARRGHSLDRSLLRGQRSVGRALVLSSVVLAAGLGCLQLSGFLPTARFGLLTAVSSLVALLGDLVLLPAAVRLFGRL